MMLGFLTSSFNQYLMCQQTACTLIQKETPPVLSHRCSADPCVPSPPGLEVITNFASLQIQPCDSLVDAEGIGQGLNKKWSVKRLPDPFLDARRV